MVVALSIGVRFDVIQENAKSTLSTIPRHGELKHYLGCNLVQYYN